MRSRFLFSHFLPRPFSQRVQVSRLLSVRASSSKLLLRSGKKEIAVEERVLQMVPRRIGARSKFLGGVAGSEDFAFATLPITPLNFQDKIKTFCHPTLLKIRFKIIVTPPVERAKSKLRCFNKL